MNVVFYCVETLWKEDKSKVQYSDLFKYVHIKTPVHQQQTSDIQIYSVHSESILTTFPSSPSRSIRFKSRLWQQHSQTSSNHSCVNLVGRVGTFIRIWDPGSSWAGFPSGCLCTFILLTSLCFSFTFLVTDECHTWNHCQSRSHHQSTIQSTH